MPTSAQLEKNIAKYDAEAPNIQAKLTKQVIDQYNNNIPWLQDVATWQNNVLPEFYQQFQGGTGAADLSPEQQMLQGSRAVSRVGKTADVARGVLNTQMSREDSMIKDLLSAWQMSRQGAVDAWTRQMQKEAAARASAAQNTVDPFKNFKFTDGSETTTTTDKNASNLPKSYGAKPTQSIQQQILNSLPGAAYSMAKNALPESVRNALSGISKLFR
jgi:hypothetical protein